MKYLLLILLSLGVQAQELSEQEQINQLTVNKALSALVSRVDQNCKIKTNPKRQIPDPENADLIIDDPTDVTSDYERTEVLDEKFLNCQAGKVRSLKELSCVEVMEPSCTLPSFDDLKLELPKYKAERQLSLDKSNEYKSDVDRQSAISNYIPLVLKDFKIAYPEYANMDEGAIRRDIYNTFGTETKMAKLEELVKVITDAEAAKKAAEAARKARVEELKAKPTLTLAELTELIKKM